MIKIPPHRFGPGYDHNKTHSWGIRPHPHDNEIAKSLLRATSNKIDNAVKEGKLSPEYTIDDDRPLIDKLHEATFTDPIGLQYIADKYQLRMLIRKAHCFTLDDETSAMVADFSYAIARDLDTVRQIAIPPFPITWIDINNVARLNRIVEIGGKLTDTAAGKTEAGAPTDRVGWLIWPAKDLGGHYLLYVTWVAQGILVSPLSWWWHNGSPSPLPLEKGEDQFIEQLTFGVKDPGTGANAFVSPSNLHLDYMRNKLFSSGNRYHDQIRDQMLEISGELRRVFGFLMGLHAMKAMTADQPKSTSPLRTMPNGKPLLPLEHKILHLHLRPRTTIKDLTLRAITKHKMREHDVRAHLRTLHSGRIVPVKSHTRGDKKLGRIEKTYKVEK